jgi:hypothetical protein
MLAELRTIELKLRARRLARVVERIQIPAVPSVSSPADGPLSVSDVSDSWGLLSSISEILADEKDRKTIVRAASWAVPVFFFVLVVAAWAWRATSVPQCDGHCLRPAHVGQAAPASAAH